MTMENQHRQSRSGRSPSGTAGLALDDITTEDAGSFGFEWSALLRCWVWLFAVSARPMRTRRAIGLVSFGMLAFATAAVRQVGPDTQPGRSLEYVITLAGLLGFTGLSVYLAAPGWRSYWRTNAPGAR